MRYRIINWENGRPPTTAMAALIERRKGKHGSEGVLRPAMQPGD